MSRNDPPRPAPAGERPRPLSPTAPAAAPVSTAGFHHVGFVSSDADRTARFYGELLGLSPLNPSRMGLLHDPATEADLPSEGGAGGGGSAVGGSTEGGPDVRGSRSGGPDASDAATRASSAAGAAAPSSRRHPGLLFGAPDGAPGSLLAFRVAPGARRGKWGVGGIHHLALSVADEGALLRWKRRLSDHGVAASGPIDRGYFTSLYFRDPDGHILELATEGPGYDLDEPADALGEGFMTPPDRRLRGHRDEEAIARAIHPEPVPEVEPAMRIGGIHHVTGIADDLEAAHHFYTTALGLRLVKQTVNQDDARTRHLFWARYTGGEVAKASAMTLFGWPGSDYRARPGVGQTSHVGFRAANEEELGRWMDHLRRIGVPVRRVEVDGRLLGLRFQAPDGLPVELALDEVDGR